MPGKNWLIDRKQIPYTNENLCIGRHWNHLIAVKYFGSVIKMSIGREYSHKSGKWTLYLDVLLLIVYVLTLIYTLRKRVSEIRYELLRIIIFFAQWVGDSSVIVKCDIVTIGMIEKSVHGWSKMLSTTKHSIYVNTIFCWHKSRTLWLKYSPVNYIAIFARPQEQAIHVFLP